MLNNWHGADVDANGVFTDEAKASVEERMEQIQVELPKDAERPRMGPLTKQYLSNRDHCVAQDQALQSVTSCLGLVHFQADRVPGLLAQQCLFAFGPDEPMQFGAGGGALDFRGVA